MLNQSFLQELEQESAVTRRVLERVPEADLMWRPHAKSMTMGQLAYHVATLPAALSQLASLAEYDVTQANFTAAQPASKAEMLAAHDAAIPAARAYLSSLSDEALQSHWRLVKGAQTLWDIPRSSLLRSIMMNHLYHHRGQLSVYLRLRDVPVPSIYGPSADDNIFA